MYVKNEVYNSEIFGWSHKSGEKNLLKTYTHRCEPAKGGRGNSTLLYCEASRKASRGTLNTRLASPTHSPTQRVGERDWLRQHILQLKGLENEIASPTHSPTQRVGERDCFVASLLAMTIEPAVIARLPFGKAWQSRFANLWFANRVGESKSIFNGMYYNPSPKNTRLRA